MARTPAYTHVAGLSRSLVRAGALVASGGGPGAMEAAHLGACWPASPVVFLDLDRCWNKKLVVAPILRELFGDDAHDQPAGISDDPQHLLDFPAIDR